MNLKRSIKDNLCKTFRAAGLPKDRALPILNEIEKWYRSSGEEWTVERLKAIHNWYISQLTDEPNIPAWIARHRRGVPKGPFKCVFEMKNMGAALMILSCHTQFLNSTISDTQREKLRDSLESKEVQCKIEGTGKLKRPPKLNFVSPTLACLTGVSIPAGPLVYRLSESSTLEERARAYKGSWFHLPGETLKFIRESKLDDLAPEILIDKNFREPVGTLSCLQEPSLKARWISNPNRITQHFLAPLGMEWREQLRKAFPINDCTQDQLKGAMWAQTKLKGGVRLASVDLTSATDKLNLSPCLDILHCRFYGENFSKLRESWSTSRDGNRYVASVVHFQEVSRGDWLLEGKTLKWNAGWPLGTKPSFPLLGTVNNMVAATACHRVGLDPTDAYRVLGDDLIIDARAKDGYIRGISRLGGVVNLSKTLVSDKVAEFAGFVITRRAILPKRVNTRDLSDNSFMLVASTVGPTAYGCLRPRQRKVWDNLKEVPGVAVGGMYPLQSSGSDPMWMRYQWYLQHVDPSDKDYGVASDFSDPRQDSIRMVLALKEKVPDLMASGDTRWWIPKGAFAEYVEVPKPWETQRVSKATSLKVEHGDPRMVNGLTLLQAAENILEKDGFKPYQTFKAESGYTKPRDDEEKSLSPTTRPQKRKGRSR